jgi:hypothetical protein
MVWGGMRRCGEQGDGVMGGHGGVMGGGDVRM